MFCQLGTFETEAETSKESNTDSVRSAPLFVTLYKPGAHLQMIWKRLGIDTGVFTLRDIRDTVLEYCTQESLNCTRDPRILVCNQYISLRGLI